MSSFQKRLRAARIARHWSQTDLARRCDLLQQDVSDYETGDKTPDILTFARLTATLDVDVCWLAGLYYPKTQGKRA